MKIHIEELGGIKSKWCSCPDGILRCLGDEKEPDEIIFKRAISAAKFAQKVEKIEAQMRIDFPGCQLYRGSLPAFDVDYNDSYNGEYIYVLKNRKKNGKYQILHAEKI